MKPVKPVSHYEEDRYPSAKAEGVSRRGFVRVVLGSAGAAALGAAIGTTAWEDEAEAGGRRLPGVARRPKLRAVIDIKPDYKLRGGKSAVASITTRTYDHSLVAFLRNKKEHAGIQKVVLRVLRRHNYKDVIDAKRLYKLRRKVAAAVAQRYQKRTKRKARYVWIQLDVVPTATS